MRRFRPGRHTGNTASGGCPLYKPINGAKSTVGLTMCELNDQTAGPDLEQAAARGVDVRVLVDQHPEKSSDTAACTY